MTNEQVKTAFLNALAGPESGGAYDILFGGSRFSDFSRFPQWSGLQGPAGTSHAAGKYQFEPATWAEEQQRLGLPDFTPASQDAGAWDLAARVYQAHTGRKLLEDLQAGDTSQVASALHSTWTSLNNATFSGRFQRELAKQPGASEPAKPAPVKVVSVQPQPAPEQVMQPMYIAPGHVATMASAGVSYAVVVSLVWLLSLYHISVPEVVQDGWVVLVTAIGGWFLHSHLVTQLGLEEEDGK